MDWSLHWLQLEPFLTGVEATARGWGEGGGIEGLRFNNVTECPEQGRGLGDVNSLGFPSLTSMEAR